MEEKEFKELMSKLEKEAGVKIEALRTEAQNKIDAFIKEKGENIPKAELKKEIDSILAPITERATQLEDAVQEQGKLITGLQDRKPLNEIKTLDDIIKENAKDLKKFQKEGHGFIEIPLKSAALTSIANSVTALSPSPLNSFMPGLNNQALTVYDILRNPAFVSSYTNNGTTDSSMIAWANETSLQGSPALVTEGNSKPLIQHIFEVEFSKAKKIAAYIQLTDEFDKDLAYLSTQVQNMLKLDVLRFFDDQVQADVINAATQITPASFNSAPLSAYKGKVFDATFWDALMVLRTFVRLNNFNPNVSLINPVLYSFLQMGKDTVGRYNYPSDAFQAKLNPIEGNKMPTDMALVGDLQQFIVLIYEAFNLKMGWINDDLIKNQFCIVGEVRFHDFISKARKLGIAYGDARYIAETINGSSNVIIGS